MLLSSSLLPRSDHQPLVLPASFARLPDLMRNPVLTASGHLHAVAVAELNVGYPNRNREQAEACLRGKVVPKH